MPQSTDWRDIETKGYVVVPGFFSPELCDALANDFATGAPPSSYPHGFKLVARAVLDKAWRRLEPALAEIREATSLKVDLLHFLTLSHYINTRGVERTSYWHQDFDLDYKLTGDHIDYLNFWIPVVKPDRDKSNVCIIPFDALRERSPAGYDRLNGSGGHRLIPKDGKTLVFGNYGSVLKGDETAPELVLDFDIETIAATPPLSRGDLLLMRGDLLHRTQDSSTERTSASIRVTSSAKTITKARALSGRVEDPTKDPAAKINATIDRCFAAFGRDEITLKELVDFGAGVVPKAG